MIKRIFMTLAALLTALHMAAQTQDFERRYNLLVSQVGPAGVGIETLINNWAKADQDNDRMLTAKFHYYLTKAQRTEVVTKETKKYLGTDPVLSLKDSTGADVFYFQVLAYDDELFREAINAVDRAIEVYPERLDFRFMKTNAYVSYERESPDIALANLIGLTNDFVKGTEEWTYDGNPADAEFFADAMQEYCISFYTLATPSSYEAFRKLSEVMIGVYPSNMAFLSNIGTYHMLVKDDCKTALKYYNKVLKKNPSDYTAIKNSCLAARKLGNVKMEKKYLTMLAEHGTDIEKAQAKARIDALNK
ncbi:MAG: hypothetical protein IJB05_06305 [Bacteroidales bacterium]|nr:hypothetical protein [Bacteroidales bacterium]